MSEGRRLRLEVVDEGSMMLFDACELAVDDVPSGMIEAAVLSRFAFELVD